VSEVWVLHMSRNPQLYLGKDGPTANVLEAVSFDNRESALVSARTWDSLADGEWRPQRLLSLTGGEMLFASRALLERCRDLAARVLAFSGDAPDRDLVKLQHELAELLHQAQAPAPILNPEQT
jgi:hypothetical protein